MNTKTNQADAPRVHERPTLYILHENEGWIAGLLEELKILGVRYELWFIDNGVNGESVDWSQPPPEGVYFNRISCSSHTRDHPFSVRYTQVLLDWLELHGRRVVNGSQAFRLEVDKTLQYMLLGKEGIRYPNTITCTDHASILDAVETWDPVMLKDNQGGSGSGVYRFTGRETREVVEKHLAELNYPISPDGITLVQRYISAAGKRINRVELIGGDLVYRLSVDTSAGFNLCPAVSCEVENCPLKAKGETFTVVEPLEPKIPSHLEDGCDGLISAYKAFSRRHGLHVVAFEYMVDSDGIPWTYDVNCNTNYNLAAEKRWGAEGYAFRRLAQYLGSLCVL